MNIKFSLPIEEYIFENCFVELEGILSNLKKIKGIIICSLDMIPNDKKYLNYFFKKLIKSKCEVHFILNKLIIKDSKDVINFFEENELISKIQKISQKTDLIKIRKYL